MKKLIASASMVAVGAAGLQAAYAPGLTRTQTSKPWNISASLRGFYDDNYATAPTDSDADRDSFGFEVSPMAAINFPLQQSYLGASYRYSMKYYEDRDKNSADHTHEFKLKADHRFTERYQVFLDEAFVYSQEPELVEPSNNAPIRTDADAMRNQVAIGLNTALTERVGVNFGYSNSYYDYNDDGIGSRSAQLDRMEHLIHLDGLYELREDIDAVLGYQFGSVGYTGDEYLFYAPNPADPKPAESDIRDSTSHYFYVGADGDWTATLKSTVRVGFQYIDFNDLGQDSVSPYASSTLTYTYSPGSYVQFGATHRRYATDILGNNIDPITGLPIVGNSVERIIVADQESTSVFASVNHRITAKLTGNLMITGQHGEFNEGSYDGDADDFLVLGANLDYQINQFLAAEAGYNLDRLDSELPDRSFTRNRVYLGVRASY